MRDDKKKKAQPKQNSKPFDPDTLNLRVVDAIALQEYKRLAALPIFNDKSTVLASDGREYKLSTPAHIMERYCRHLPEKEQKKIVSLCAYAQTQRNRMSAMLKKAYNTQINNKGELTKIISGSNKLEERRADIIELFGRLFNTNEVFEIVRRDFQLQVSREALKKFREDNIEEITALNEKHKREYDDLRFVHKRSRLEELTWLYTQRKRIYDITKKSDDYRLLLDTLKQIKNEVEGDVIKFDATIDVNIKQEINNHINQEMLKFVNLKEIIMSRIAAKNGVNGLKVVKAISEGYYYKQLHDEEALSSGIFEKPMFPSMMPYDFEAIGRRHEQQVQQAQVVNTVVNAAAETTKTFNADEVKAKLLQKLKGLNEDVNYQKNNLNPLFEKTTR